MWLYPAQEKTLTTDTPSEKGKTKARIPPAAAPEILSHRPSWLFCHVDV
jgi:hypothetical protein